jgi:hypothetical protein
MSGPRSKVAIAYQHRDGVWRSTVESSTASQERSADLPAIESTVRDYFEGWFGGDASRMKRALHPDLAKRSKSRDGGSDAVDTISAQSMIEATEAGHGTKYPPERRHFEIAIDDVYGDIATVTVRSDVYREYVHLVRTRDGWKIANALWQLVEDEGGWQKDRQRTVSEGVDRMMLSGCSVGVSGPQWATGG